MNATLSLSCDHGSLRWRSHRALIASSSKSKWRFDCSIFCLADISESACKRTAELGSRMVTSIFRQLARALLPDTWRTTLSGAIPRYSRLSQGSGTGLYFDSGPGNSAYRTGANELPVQVALARYLRAGDVFYDIGANVGFFTVIGARLVGPTGAVYAFEPVKQNARFVRRNAQRNGFGNVTVIPKAVSDRTGRASLYLAEYAGGAVLSVAAPPPDLKGTVCVDAVSIDDSCATGKLPAPSVVKIDVEGAELHVLNGMRRTLVNATPVVIFELDDRTKDALAKKQAACEDLLRSLGYSVERIEDSYTCLLYTLRAHET
jgi:FkbM family methyltransferase